MHGAFTAYQRVSSFDDSAICKSMYNCTLLSKCPIVRASMEEQAGSLHLLHSAQTATCFDHSLRSSDNHMVHSRIHLRTPFLPEGQPTLWVDGTTVANIC